MKEALLDADIITYYNRRHPQVVQRFSQYVGVYDKFHLAITVQFEVLSGLMHKQAFGQIARFEDFIQNYCIVHFITDRSMRLSADVRAHLLTIGKKVESMDLLTAGIALEHDLAMVTNNESHFGRIPGLEIDNWSR